MEGHTAQSAVRPADVSSSAPHDQESTQMIESIGERPVDRTVRLMLSRNPGSV